jgi:hypothetical protein
VATTVSSSKIFERDLPLFVESETGRLPKYPASRLHRWSLRAVCATFYAALAIWWDVASGHDWSGTPNHALAERVASIGLTTSVEGIAQLYPPITSLAAVLIPGGPLGLAIAGAVIAAFTLQFLLQSLRRKSLPLSLRVIFTLSLATTPLYTYTVVTNFEATVALLFFGVGMVDLVRFASWANTQAGFRAGILFACAAFSDSTTVFAALVAAAGGGLLVQSRPRARLANAVVVAFPTVTLFASLAALGIAFRAGPLSMVRGDLEWHPERAEGFLLSLGSPVGWLYLAPMVIMIITSVALGYPGTGLIAVFLVLSILLAYFLGLTPPGVAGVAYALLLLLALAIVPRPTSIAQSILTAVVSVALWTVGWLTALQWRIVMDWMHVFGGAS